MMVPDLKIERMRTDELVPYAHNAKIHTPEQVRQIAASIDQFGFSDPVGVWTRPDGRLEIVEGHGRVMAAKELGIGEVPVIRLDHLDDDARRAYAHVHNQTTLTSGFDMDELAVDMADLPEFDWTAFGFDAEQVNPFDVNPENNVEEDEPPEDGPSRVSTGDIWQLGRHRLMCGDSTESDSVKILMNGSTADLAFQSPPYNIGKNAKLNDRVDENKYLSYVDDNPEYKRLLYLTTENALSNASYVAVNIQALSGNKRIFAQWLADFKELLCDIAIWYKDNAAPAMASRVMNSSFEFVIFFSKESQTRAIGTNDFRGTVSNVYQSHVQNKNEYSKVHSATFPIEFVANYIGNFTNKNDSILDLFGGTGTTLIAAEQLGRTCYMMELDPHYCDIIIERWERFTGERAVKVDGND